MSPSRLSAPFGGISRDTAARECHRREAGRSSVSRCKSRSDRATSRTGQFGSGLSSRGSPGGTASSEEVAARPDARTVVCPETERSIKPAGDTLATPLRSDCATEDTSLAIEPTQLSHTVWKQHLSSVFLLQVLHETSISHVSGEVCTALWSAKVPLRLFLPWRSPGILRFLAVAELVELLVPRANPRYAGSELTSSQSWLFGL